MWEILSGQDGRAPLAHSRSQSEHRNCYILLTRGFSHIIIKHNSTFLPYFVWSRWVSSQFRVISEASRDGDNGKFCGFRWKWKVIKGRCTLTSPLFQPLSHVTIPRDWIICFNPSTFSAQTVPHTTKYQLAMAFEKVFVIFALLLGSASSNYCSYDSDCGESERCCPDFVCRARANCCLYSWWLPRGTQREYSSKPHKHSVVERTLVFKRYR